MFVLVARLHAVIYDRGTPAAGFPAPWFEGPTAMPCFSRTIAPWLLCLLVLPLAATAETITYFRGDRGLAGRDDQRLPETFDEKTEQLWRVPVDSGHSTPCVTATAIYLTTFDADKKLNTVALDRATGKLLWSQTSPATRLEEYHSSGSPAVSTPACDDARVYSFFGSYGLLCYDTAGKLLWSKPMPPFQDEFGSSSSPVLIDGKLLLNEDHDLNSFLLCVDAATGNTVWQTAREGFTRSYATPVLWESSGGKQVIVAGALELAGYDLETGKQRWSLSGLARIVNTTPAAHGGMLYVATWSPGGDSDARIGMEPWDIALKLWDKNQDKRLVREECDNKDVLDRFYRIDLNQDKGLDEYEWQKYAKVFELARNSIMAIRPAFGSSAPPQVVWQYEKGIPYVSSPLVYRDVVYLVKDGGIVTSLDALSGKVLKQARARGTGTYYSSPVAGDGKVFMVSDRGVLSVLKAEGQWSVLNSRDFGERTVATPVIHDGKVFIRTEAALYCFGVKS